MPCNIPAGGNLNIAKNESFSPDHEHFQIHCTSLPIMGDLWSQHVLALTHDFKPAGFFKKNKSLNSSSSLIELLHYANSPLKSRQEQLEIGAFSSFWEMGKTTKDPSSIFKFAMECHPSPLQNHEVLGGKKIFPSVVRWGAEKKRLLNEKTKWMLLNCLSCNARDGSD